MHEPDEELEIVEEYEIEEVQEYPECIIWYDTSGEQHAEPSE